MVKHSSFVHRPDDTGLESLVKALQEEAFEIKAELADWKNKATETGTLKEDLERTISKLEAEVEGWKDRFAMAAGQRIVARRQLDDFAKQVLLHDPLDSFQITGISQKKITFHWRFSDKMFSPAGDVVECRVAEMERCGNGIE